MVRLRLWERMTIFILSRRSSPAEESVFAKSRALRWWASHFWGFWLRSVGAQWDLWGRGVDGFRATLRFQTPANRRCWDPAPVEQETFRHGLCARSSLVTGRSGAPLQGSEASRPRRSWSVLTSCLPCVTYKKQDGDRHRNAKEARTRGSGTERATGLTFGPETVRRRSRG